MKKNLTTTLFFLLYSFSIFAQTTVSTFAGNGNAGDTDGVGVKASFNKPRGVTVDASGNVYVADESNNKIKKITPDGLVTTYAGTGTAGSIDSTKAAFSSFDLPIGIVADPLGNIYIGDWGSSKIRKISSSGAVSTFAGHGYCGSTDGIGVKACIDMPQGLAIDAAGNIYVAQYNIHRIRKITPAGVVSTLAGTGWTGSDDGPGASASFYYPSGVAVDASGNVYVTDSYNNKIRKISPEGIVSTFAGTGQRGAKSGPAATSTFSNPGGIAIDGSGNLYIADTESQCIRMITPTGIVSTIAGGTGDTDGPADFARFNYPIGITVHTNGDLYIADFLNHKIRKITGVKTGLNDEIVNTDEFSIYPNPAKNTLSIESPFILSAYQITDITGKELAIGNVVNNIDVSTLYNGIYLIRITSHKGTLVKKFTKE